MAITYGSAVQITAWTNPRYALNKKYSVIPYRDGAAVTADQLLDVSREEAEAHFQLLVSRTTNNELYDQIAVTEATIQVPS